MLNGSVPSEQGFMAAKTDQPDAAPREIELKLEGASDVIQGIAGLPALVGAVPDPGQTGHLAATYFDTPDQALRRAGLSVRLRREGDRTVQTIKAEKGARGLVLDRDEWEQTVEGDRLDFKAAAKTALKPFIVEGRDRIGPAFRVDTHRAAFRVQRDGALIELVVDDARIAAENDDLRFGEVELELKEGNRKAIFGLALDLVAAAPLRLSLATKSERGYALLDGEKPKAVKAERIEVPVGASSAEAFRIIARSCLAQTIRNEVLFRQMQEPLALHQMRVGLRRLRAAASLFKDILTDDESIAIRAELRWMNHALGPVRDLDVLVRRMRELPEADRARGHGRALAAAERRRREATEHVLQLLDELRFRRAILATAAWIEGGAWIAPDDEARQRVLSRRVAKRAADELSRRRRKVLKRAKGLAALDPEARHQVRIEIKKLRYGTEFFGPLFAGRKAKERRRAALKALESLQEILGELNDIAIGGHILAPAPMAPLDGATGQGQEEELLERAATATRALAKAKPFWE
jgi:triphosphatase